MTEPPAVAHDERVARDPAAVIAFGLALAALVIPPVVAFVVRAMVFASMAPPPPGPIGIAQRPPDTIWIAPAALIGLAVMFGSGAIIVGWRSRRRCAAACGALRGGRLALGAVILGGLSLAWAVLPAVGLAHAMGG